MVSKGSAAFCGNPSGARVRASPAAGCVAFEREPSADDGDDAPAAVDLWAAWRMAPASLERPAVVLEMLSRSQTRAEVRSVVRTNS